MVLTSGKPSFCYFVVYSTSVFLFYFWDERLRSPYILTDGASATGPRLKTQKNALSTRDENGFHLWQAFFTGQHKTWVGGWGRGVFQVYSPDFQL